MGPNKLCNGIFTKQTIDIASKGWKVRRVINALRVIPMGFYVVPTLQKSESFDQKHIVETVEDIVAFSAMVLGVVLLGSSLTGTPLGKTGALAGKLALILWVTESSINLSRRLSGNGSGGALLRSGLNFGFCLAALSEIEASSIQSFFGSTPFCHGLVGQGFGILFTGFGTAAAFARILT